LCHLNTAVLPKASSPYYCLIIWNISLADLPYFRQNLTFAHCSNCDILNLRRSQTTTIQTVAFFVNTQHARNFLLLWDERRTDTAPSHGSAYQV
jgi:hypothetical protein